MTNAIHADEKQSREGLLFGLGRPWIASEALPELGIRN